MPLCPFLFYTAHLLSCVEGILYRVDFFKSDSIHEVPGFDGNRARVVVGAFIGHTEDDPDIAVWS